MTDAVQGPLAVGNFQLQSQLAGQSGQGISISGYLYDDDDEAKINARLDLYKRVIDRQQKISEIPMLEAKLGGLREAQTQHTDMLRQIEEKQKQHLKISSQELMHAKNLPVNIKHLGEQIKDGEQAIAKLRHEVS